MKMNEDAMRRASIRRSIVQHDRINGAAIAATLGG